MSKDALSSLVGSKWTGNAELWLDPLGNDAILCTCEFDVQDGRFSYTWSYEGKPQSGTYVLTDAGADWNDTWHMEKGMSCPAWDVPGALFAVVGSYPAPEGPPWGWRSVLALRPSGELVLQMTNVTPWGEDGRAVRMVATRA